MAIICDKICSNSKNRSSLSVRQCDLNDFYACYHYLLSKLVFILKWNNRKLLKLDKNLFWEAQEYILSKERIYQLQRAEGTDIGSKEKYIFLINLF